MNNRQGKERIFLNRKLHILTFLKGSTIISGVNSYFRILARELIRLGHRVTTIIIDPRSNEIYDYLGKDAGSIEAISKKGNRYRSLLNLFREKRPSIVINHYSRFGLQGSAIAKYHGIDFHNIYICHADTNDHYNIIAHFSPIIDQVIATSAVCSLEVGKRFPHKFPIVTSLPAAVDLPKSQVIIPASGPLSMVYSGRMEQRQKRILDFIPLFLKLDSLGVHYKFNFVGEGSDIEQLRSLLSQSSVVFHGRVSGDKMNEIFSQSHIIIMMSEFEGTSVSLLEAMGHGIVPVITKLRGIENLIKHNKNGLLFSIGNIEEAVRHISFLDQNRKQANRLGSEARLTVKQDYSPIEMAKSFMQSIFSNYNPTKPASEDIIPFLSGGHFGLFDKPYLPGFPAQALRQISSIAFVQSILKRLH